MSSSAPPSSAVSKAPSRAAIIAGFAAIYLIWGSTYLGIRVAVETIPPFLMIGTRYFVAGLIITAIIAVQRGFRAKAHQWRDNAIIGGFLCLGGTGLVSWSEQKIPSGITTLIVSISPLFIVLMDWAVFNFFRDGKRGSKPNAFTFVGLALGFVGLVLLVGPDVMKTGAGHLDPLSVLGLIGATLFWGIGSLATRYAHEPADPYTASAIQMLCGSVWIMIVSFLNGEVSTFQLSAVSAVSAWSWVYLVVFGSLIGFTTFVWLMQHCTPARVSTYAYVNPIVAVFLGWWILQEPVSPRIFVAAAIIIAGVAIITIAKSKKKTSPIPEVAPTPQAASRT
ncbi:EamA family transporter [Oleiharenicola lentus]|uniref:EamA family transporter n=1 Tax=Oleiharenicola lentus TaxID=2508720 RepID=UPI003F66F39D